LPSPAGETHNVKKSDAFRSIDPRLIEASVAGPEAAIRATEAQLDNIAAFEDDD
jgi:multidrug resistance efflux pump